MAAMAAVGCRQQGYAGSPVVLNCASLFLLLQELGQLICSRWSFRQELGSSQPECGEWVLNSTNTNQAGRELRDSALDLCGEVRVRTFCSLDRAYYMYFLK